MILLVNDDGIHAPDCVPCTQPCANIVSVQFWPSHHRVNNLAKAKQSPIHRSLRVIPQHEQDFFGFAIDGTPADCAKLALTSLCGQRPQLVVSGINHGPNVGRSIFTVALLVLRWNQRSWVILLLPVAKMSTRNLQH